MIKVTAKRLKCSACNSSDLNKFSHYGIDLIYTRVAQKKKNYNFYICSKCGYMENRDYKKTDLKKLKYDNYTFSSKYDSRDLYLKELIINLIQNEFVKDEYQNIVFIEYGPGKRLNLLLELEKCFPNCNFYAIDPLYSKNLINQIKASNTNSNINYIEDIKKLKIEKAIKKIFIARNSLEFTNPNQLREIIKSYFVEDCLIISEINTPNILNSGSIYLFTECLAFYNKKSLSEMFKQEGLYLDVIFSTKLYSDSREFFIAKLIKNSKYKNIREFRSIFELVSYCDSQSSNSNFVMWGAGGRNIMFILNEGRNLINKVVDIDSIRIGVVIPDFGKISPISDIEDKDVIVCLNSRFLTKIRESKPNNIILLLKEFD